VGAKTAPNPQFALDTSALVTMIQNAPGGSLVGARIARSAISTVNWSEVVDSSRADGLDVSQMRQNLESLGLRIYPFTVDDADRAAELQAQSPKIQLSLSDRACLALASRLGVPALTADSSWKKLSLGVEIQLLR